MERKLYGNSRIRKISTAGVITTVAGNGVAGFSGDGGRATSAQMAGPVGLAVDDAGNLFISEYLNSRVRKVAPDGIITTVAGGGPCCDPGDGGLAVSAPVAEPHGIAVDSAGNLYIAEWPFSRIRKVSPSGIISTIAGNGVSGFSGDGGPAAQAQLSSVWGLATDRNGDLFIADTQNSRIRKIGADGIITTIAGGPSSPLPVDAPHGVAVDAAGNVFSSGGWRISPSGTQSIVEVRSRRQLIPIDGVAIASDPWGGLILVTGNAVLRLAPLDSRLTGGAPRR